MKRLTATLAVVLAPVAVVLAAPEARASGCWLWPHAVQWTAGHPPSCPLYLYDRPPESSEARPFDIETLRAVRVVDGVEEELAIEVSEAEETLIWESFETCAGPDCTLDQHDYQVDFLRYAVTFSEPVADGTAIIVRVDDSAEVIEIPLTIDATATCWSAEESDERVHGGTCTEQSCEDLYPETCGYNAPDRNEGEDDNDNDGLRPDQSRGCRTAGGQSGGLALWLLGAMLLTRRRLC